MGQGIWVIGFMVLCLSHAVFGCDRASPKQDVDLGSQHDVDLLPDTCVPSCEGKTCGDDGCSGECQPGCASDELCQQGSCQGVAAATREEILGFLSTMPFEFADMDRPRGPTTLSISNTFWIDETVKIEIGELNNPCEQGQSCEFVGFELFGSIPGASVDASGGASFAETMVRFRGLFQDNHPELPAVLAKVLILPSPSIPCAGEVKRCSRDDVCYQSYQQYCAFCTDLLVNTCACGSWSGTEPEGQECEFWFSGDVLYSGKCTGGECQVCQSNADCRTYNPYLYCWVRFFTSGGTAFLSKCDVVSCSPGGECSDDHKCCDEDVCVLKDEPCP